MKNKLIKIACFSFVAAALLASPAISRADDSTNAPAAAAPAHKKHGLPIHGKVASVDTAAMTFTIGETTIAVTSATKIKKDGQPATFSDITVGEMVSANYKKDESGKATAVSVNIGQKKKKDAAPPQQ